MTPEELNRKIEFIVDSQARLAAAQEQDRQDRVKFEEWSKGLLAQITRTNDRLSKTDDRLSHTDDRLSQMLSDQSRILGDLSRVSVDQGRISGDLSRVSVDQGRISGDLSRVSVDQARILGDLSRVSMDQARLLDHQSQRMDRLDKFYDDWLRQNGEFQQQVLDLQRQALHLLNLILDRLPSAWPPPAPG
jgi:chromosome segregation ATPase